MTRIARHTFILTDGENVYLGLKRLLGGRIPSRRDHVRWAEITRFFELEFGVPATQLYFYNAERPFPAARANAIRAHKCELIPARDLIGDGEQVVDRAIIHAMGELGAEDANVVVVSNDGDYCEQLTVLRDDRWRLVALGAFRGNPVSHRYRRVGVKVYDLGHDIGAISRSLPGRTKADLLDQETTDDLNVEQYWAFGRDAMEHGAGEFKARASAEVEANTGLQPDVRDFIEALLAPYRRDWDDPQGAEIRRDRRRSR